MRFFQKIKNWKTVRGWHIWKLKLVDARLYFVSMIVGLLTGLIAVCYHYLLYFLLHIRSDFFGIPPCLVLAYTPVFAVLGDSDVCVLSGRQDASYQWRRHSADTPG